MKYHVQLRRVWHETIQLTIDASSQLAAECKALKEAKYHSADWSEMGEMECIVECVDEVTERR